jgi:hypothetical protein
MKRWALAAVAAVSWVGAASAQTLGFDSYSVNTYTEAGYRVQATNGPFYTGIPGGP